MDGCALPTYAVSGSSAKKKSVSKMRVSEQQLLYCRAMGVVVSSDQEPLGVQRGDLWWEEELAHPDVAIVRGASYTVGWTLMIKRSVFNRVSSWNALIEEALLPVHMHLSKWNEKSTLSMLNCGANQLPSDLFLMKQAIDLCHRLHRASQGRFDPSIAPLLEAWNDALNKSEAGLSATRLQELMKFVGWDQVVKEYCVVQPGAKIDLDGISKVCHFFVVVVVVVVFFFFWFKIFKNRDSVLIWFLLGSKK